MKIVLILVPVALSLALLFIFLFGWATLRGQYDDTETPAQKILTESDNSYRKENT